MTARKGRWNKIFGLTVAAALLGAGTFHSTAAAGRLAPLAAAGSADEIPGAYIVVLRGEPQGLPVSQPAVGRARAAGARIKQVYQYAISGYSAELSKSQLDKIRRDPDVAYVTADRMAHMYASQTPTPSWGLDRIDQRQLPLNSTYNFTMTGAGVTAYVIDSGIRQTHTEFTGRIDPGVSFVDDGQGTNDCGGHGTHVAGTIGGSTAGVAKGVRLVPVRVFGCSGGGAAISTVAAAVDWVTNHHQTHPGPAVANMSLGHTIGWWEFFFPVEEAIRASMATGIAYSLAAGNNNADACNQSPGRMTGAMTVAATTRTDVRSDFSNYGSCVDLFAPGTEIRSAGIGSDTEIVSKNGTSMATPHVTGAAALFLQENPAATPDIVGSSLIYLTTRGVVSDAGASSPNRLLAVSVPLTTVIPHVLSISCAEATAELADAGLKAKCTGTGTWVKTQTPAAGVTVLLGTTVTLRMGSGPIP